MRMASTKKRTAPYSHELVYLTLYAVDNGVVRRIVDLLLALLSAPAWPKTGCGLFAIQFAVVRGFCSHSDPKTTCLDCI